MVRTLKENTRAHLLVLGDRDGFAKETEVTAVLATTDCPFNISDGERG